jgi:hypothetical protein
MEEDTLKIAAASIGGAFKRIKAEEILKKELKNDFRTTVQNLQNLVFRIKQYEGEESIIIVTNEDEYTIEDGESFVGGFPNTYMSELLGNVAYDSLESIGSAIYDYIVNELNETIEEITI